MTRSPLTRNHRGGFTLVEVLIASALLGFSLVVMFGFHVQAVRSNYHARKQTDCTYLAQAQLEEMLSLDWTAASMPSEFNDDGDGATDEYGGLYYPEQVVGGQYPDAISSLMSTTKQENIPRPTYFDTWEVDYMDDDPTWLRVRVRCSYQDPTFGAFHGVTLSTYRYRDA